VEDKDGKWKEGTRGKVRRRPGWSGGVCSCYVDYVQQSRDFVSRQSQRSCCCCCCCCWRWRAR